MAIKWGHHSSLRLAGFGDSAKRDRNASLALGLLAVPSVGVPFGDAMTPLEAGITVEKDEAARHQTLHVFVSSRIAAEIHVDRRSQAHGRNNGAEAVPVDVGCDPLSRQVLVDNRLFERLVRVEQLLRFLRCSFTHHVRQLRQPLGQWPDSSCFVEPSTGVVVPVAEVQHTPGEVREPLRVVDMRKQPFLLGVGQKSRWYSSPMGAVAVSVAISDSCRLSLGEAISKGPSACLGGGLSEQDA